jgi:hypothetical protein
MTDQERALRLADELEAWTLGKPTHHREAAAELRRLHAENERLRAAVGKALEALERNASQDMGVVQCNLLSASALRAALKEAK